MVESPPGDEVARLAASCRPALERALVARFGLHDGLDAASTAIDHLYRHAERVLAMGNPAGYLYRVAASSARRNWFRRDRERLLVAEPVTVDRPLDIDLQRALRRLRPDQRVAVVLVHAHGHTYAEAATAMGVPVTTLTNHVTRGLRRLRALLEEPE